MRVELQNRIFNLGQRKLSFFTFAPINLLPSIEAPHWHTPKASNLWRQFNFINEASNLHGETQTDVLDPVSQCPITTQQPWLFETVVLLSDAIQPNPIIRLQVSLIFHLPLLIISHILYQGDSSSNYKHTVLLHYPWHM
jgi:hypothetical protein